MPKVFLATSVHSWDDIRVLRKEGVSLAKRYRVELHAPAPFDYREYQGVHIHGLPQWERFFDRRAIRRELRRRIRFSDAEVFHFHDPELIPLGLIVKLVYKKKVIYDIHEDYPAYFRHKAWIPRPLRSLVAAAFRQLERIACRFFDHLIATSPAIEKNYARFPTTVVLNYPRLETNGMFPEKAKDSVAFIYAGSMEEIRGIRELGQAFLRITDQTPQPVHLHIAGQVRGSRQFQQDVQAIFQHPSVQYHGALPFEAAVALMRSCHVGIIPFLPLACNVNIVPHKLFDYMAAGLTILASDYNGWPQNLPEWGIGMLFDPTRQESIDRQLIAAATAGERLEQMGRRAYRLVRECFTWVSQEERLLRAYRLLIPESEWSATDHSYTREGRRNELVKNQVE